MQLTLEGQWPEAAPRNEGNEPSTVAVCVANPTHSCSHVQKVPVPLTTAGVEGVFQITTKSLGRVTFPVNLQAVNASPGRLVSFSQEKKEENKPNKPLMSVFSHYFHHSIQFIVLQFYLVLKSA